MGPVCDQVRTCISFASDAHSLRNGGFERPRNGRKNDKAHPPIHPTGHANLAGDDKRVYDYITRRFLASCSRNATGSQTTVDISIADESFSASGLVILQRNYLDVFPYDKWEGNYLPDFQVGERFEPSSIDVRDGHTTAPNLLTEADLVALMDRNGSLSLLGYTFQADDPTTLDPDHWVPRFTLARGPVPVEVGP